MTAERWRQIRAALDRIDEAPIGERAGVIDGLCRGDADLRVHIEQLLADDGATVTSQLIRDVIAGQAAAYAGSAAEVNERFGRYRIIRRIGVGGMGAVYEAARVDDFHKKVALKIIQQEFDSAFARERFQQERQLLAALEHPYIARLIDGGESEDGRPYLVLEYVEGEPLQQYAAGLDRTGRLRLFLKVCEAVEYAHRNLVIHRDLKPANILVTAGGDPKLLDFGIAKLLQPGALKTQTGYTSLTPDYASPEQVRGLPISTASDVYSLGVILYQLLTGSKPYTLESAAPVEMDRIVCREPVPPPGLGDELDHIILMALRKEPERRYGGVPQFAEDIRRYLDQRPVSARPDTLRYRSVKFVRRNKVPLAAAASVFLALTAGLGVALYEARLANTRFKDVRSLATTFLFDFDKELSAVPGNTKARRLLAVTASRNLDNLAATAGGDEGLLAELATAYEKLGDVQGMPGISNLGLTREAADSYGKAVAILERLSRKHPRYRVRLVTDLGRSGRITGELNQFDQALELAARAARLSDRLRGESGADMELVRGAGRSFDVLASLQRGVYRAEDALQSSRRAVELFEQSIPPGAPPKASHPLAMALTRLGLVQRDLAELEAAGVSFERSLTIENQILAVEPADIKAQDLLAETYADLAALADSGRYPNHDKPGDAIAYAQKSLRIFSRLAESDPHDIRAQVNAAWMRATLALSYLRRDAAGDASVANELSENAAAAVRDVLRTTPKSGFARSRRSSIDSARAQVLARHKQQASAVELSGAALSFQREAGGELRAWDARLDLAGQLLIHAQVLVRCGQADAARPAMAEAAMLFAGVDAETRRWMSGAYQAGAYHFGLAQTLEAAGLPREGAEYYAEAARHWSAWKSGRPYIERRVAAAAAGRHRCRF